MGKRKTRRVAVRKKTRSRRPAVRKRAKTAGRKGTAKRRNVRKKRIRKKTRNIPRPQEGLRIFPRYGDYGDETTGALINEKRLRRVKMQVVKNLRRRLTRDRVIRAYNVVAWKRKLNGLVRVNFQKAIKMIKNSTLRIDPMSLEDSFGYNNGRRIYIHDTRMSDKYLTGLLLHEGLHGSALVGNKHFSERDDHSAMILLGEDAVDYNPWLV